MYNVIVDNGNVYVTNSDGDNIRFKDSDVANAIREDNSIITGDSDEVSIIVEYCNNDSSGESSVALPYYLTPEEIAKTAIE